MGTRGHLQVDFFDDLKHVSLNLYQSSLIADDSKESPILLCALKHLRIVRILIKRCPKEVKKDTGEYVRLYQSHFWVKVIEQLIQVTNQWGKVSGIHFLLRLWAIHQCGLLEEMHRDLNGGADAELIGSTKDLLAQAFITAGKSKQAMEIAIKARTWRSFTGNYSYALQSDRLMGWVSLAEGHRVNAIRFFAIGLRRALDLMEIQPTLARKLGANLVRAIWADKLSNLNDWHGVDVGLDKVKDACKTIAEACQGNNFEVTNPLNNQLKLHESICSVTQFTLFLFKTVESNLKFEMKRLCNLRSYPIFLPPEPAK